MIPAPIVRPGGLERFWAPGVPARRVAWLVGSAAFLLFAASASPFAWATDPAQFQTLARTGGIAHAGSGTSDVRRFSDGSAVAGAWSKLVTGSEGASMTLQTTGLDPGDVVTVWWVVFNAPQNCTHGEGPYRCGPGDLPPFGGDGSAAPSVPTKSVSFARVSPIPESFPSCPTRAT